MEDIIFVEEILEGAIVIGKYEVCIDVDGYHDFFESTSAVDFGGEKEKLHEIERYHKGEIDFYRVTEYSSCPCCLEWVQGDSLGCICETSPKEAVSVYKQCLGVLPEKMKNRRFDHTHMNK